MYAYANNQAFSGHLPFTYANFIYVNVTYVSATHVKHNTMLFKIIIFTLVNNYIQQSWFFLDFSHIYFCLKTQKNEVMKLYILMFSFNTRISNGSNNDLRSQRSLEN